MTDNTPTDEVTRVQAFFAWMPPILAWPLVVVGAIPIAILAVLAVCVLPPKWTGIRTVKEVIDDLCD